MENPVNYFAIISGFVVAIITFLIFIYALYRFYKFLFKNKNIFGDTIETRIVSLGITGIFFPNGLRMIFFYPVQILFESLLRFYSSINSIVANNNMGPNEFFSVITRLFSSAMENMNSWFGSFHIGSIFLALAAWSLIGQLIDSYKSPGFTNPDKPQHDILRQNIILGLIFLLSIYLSLAAIITVPYFTENKELEQKEETLKDQLEKIKGRNDVIIFSSLSSNEPVFDVDSAIMASIGTIKTVQIKNNIQRMYDTWNENYTRNIKNRKAGTDRLSQEQSKLNKTLAEEEENVLRTYAAEGVNLKSKLKLAFINSLVEYYRNFAESYINRATRIKTVIEFGDNEFKTDLSDFKRNFSEYVTNAVISDSANSAMAKETYFYTYNTDRNYYTGLEYFLAENYSIPLPTVPTPGDELGIFKGIAQWLIKPLSMALVLIVGMLGFGLFGAVISTFVKEGKDLPETEGAATGVKKEGVIINDVTGVIIRGVSAAIVIFLGVKGGLAVFSSGEGEPNPYALFFTCLVGAVYSERIWEWAKEKLTGSLAATPPTVKEDDEKGKGKEPPVQYNAKEPPSELKQEEPPS